MKLSYEENLKKDAECNYIDFDKLNAHHILRSCINNPKESNPVKNKGSINMSIQEGFSSDNASNGGGVSYIPNGSCHDGYEKDEKGECIQKWRVVIEMETGKEDILLIQFTIVKIIIRYVVKMDF